MESITLAAVALALANKVTDKVGDKLSAGAIAAARHLWNLLRRHPSETIGLLEAAPANPGWDGSGDPTVIDVKIIEDEIGRIAADNPEVQAAVEETAKAMQQQFGTVVNQAELAEKIGIVIQGGHNHINIDKLKV